jgi:hypothetical protein
MQAKPILHTTEMFVEIHKDDLAEFKKFVKSKQPPVWMPANFRVTTVEDTGYIPAAAGKVLVRVRLQYLAQQQV